MTEKFGDILQFCSHVSKLMVTEIRRRASNQSTGNSVFLMRTVRINNLAQVELCQYTFFMSVVQVEIVSMKYLSAEKDFQDTNKHLKTKAAHDLGVNSSTCGHLCSNL